MFLVVPAINQCLTSRRTCSERKAAAAVVHRACLTPPLAEWPGPEHLPLVVAHGADRAFCLVTNDLERVEWTVHGLTRHS